MVVCISCQIDIPAQWTSALNSNKCPSCGFAIMSDESKQLLDEIREAFIKMPNDPEGLAGWLLDNYSLKKIGNAEPVNFHRKPTAQPKDDEPEAPLKIADNPVQNMLKRAGVADKVAQNKQSAIAKLAKQIRSGTPVEPEQFAPTEEEVEESGSSDIEVEDEAPISIPASKLSSAFVTVDTESVVPDMEVKEAFNQHFGGEETVGQDYAHVARMERVRRQKNMLEGLSRGKNGFTRSGS